MWMYYSSVWMHWKPMWTTSGETQDEGTDNEPIIKALNAFIASEGKEMQHRRQEGRSIGSNSLSCHGR